MHPSIPPSHPIPGDPSQPPPRTSKGRSRTLLVLGLMGMAGLLLLAPVALLADHFWSLHWFRLWMQISALWLALLCSMASSMLHTVGWIRLLLLLGAALYAGGVLDSVDGLQDYFPIVVVACGSWSLLFMADTGLILQHFPQQACIAWVGVSLGGSAIGVYVAATIYYFVQNRQYGPLDYAQHPLYAVAIILGGMLRIIRTTNTPPQAPLTTCAL